MENLLAGYLMTRWEAAKSAKDPIQKDLLASLRAVRGEYDPTILALIQKQGGSEVFMHLTGIKCRAAASWLNDAILPAGEKPWAIEPTPLPDLPPEIQDQIAQYVVQENQEKIAAAQAAGLPIDTSAMREQMESIKRDTQQELKEMAEKAAKEVSKIIADQMTEGNFQKAMMEFLDNLVVFRAAFLKGPITRMRPRLVWGPDGMPAVNIVPVVEYEAPSPFDVYPSPGARSLQDEYYFERHVWGRANLEACIGIDGFDDVSIYTILDRANGRVMGFGTYDSERSKLEERPKDQESPDDSIEVLEFHGRIPGSELVSWGIEVEDPGISYEAECWMCYGIVFSARLNHNPLGRRPMYGTSFVKIAGSIWGWGIPDVMRDIQDICNSCARSLVNNMAIASGPQVWFDKNRIPPGTDITQLFPWKIWAFTSGNLGESGPPMGFFQPESNAAALLQIYQYFSDQAGEITGVPAYVYGSDKVQGAARTASGLSMLMGAATKGLKAVTRNIDMDVISPVVYDHWLYVMMFHDGDIPRGDINVRARASDALIQAEQIQIRTLEILQSTNNPTDLQITGLGGRAKLLGQALRGAKICTDGIIPDPEDINLNSAEVRMANGMKNLSVALNIPIEQLMAIAGGVAQQQQQQEKPRNLLPGGNPQGEMTA